MNRYLPNMYQSSIFTIPYQKLLQRGIRCLIFDLDNTLALLSESLPNPQVLDLITNLKQDFHVFIISNSPNKRVQPFGEALAVKAYPFSIKPFARSVRKIMNTYHFKVQEMALIGDQFLTDMALGNRLGLFTIFVDALGTKDLKVTGINRYFEQKIMMKYQTKKLFERGKYYESN